MGCSSGIFPTELSGMCQGRRGVNVVVTVLSGHVTGLVLSGHGANVVTVIVLSGHGVSATVSRVAQPRLA